MTHHKEDKKMTHGKILSQTFKLIANPIVWYLLLPSFFEFYKGFLKDWIWTYRLRFWFLGIVTMLR